jgi:hypothetical protein
MDVFCLLIATFSSGVNGRSRRARPYWRRRSRYRPDRGLTDLLLTNAAVDPVDVLIHNLAGVDDGATDYFGGAVLSFGS